MSSSSPSTKNKLIPDSSDQMWAFYRQMQTIRKTEEKFLELYTQGLLFGTVHTCIGQEACAVGVVGALDKNKDIIWSNHRGHGHYLAWTDNINALVAEIMGKKSGVCSGIGGTQHLHAERFYTNGVLGGTVACAVGSAMAEKIKKTGAIATVFFGDGALGEGIIYESLNIASLWQLPVVFVLEDNGYAQSTPSHLQHVGELKNRARSYDIQCNHISADHVGHVHQEAIKAVEWVRTNQRPYFLSLKTYRLMPHSKGDEIRSEKEIDEQKMLDPLNQFESLLHSENKTRLSQINEEVESQIDVAVNLAKEDTFLSEKDDSQKR